MAMASPRQHSRMPSANTFLAGFKGVSSILMGRQTVREVVQTLKHARIALIAVAVAAIIAALCFLVITAYIGLLLAREIAAM